LWLSPVRIPEEKNKNAAKFERKDELFWVFIAPTFTQKKLKGYFWPKLDSRPKFKGSRRHPELESCDSRLNLPPRIKAIKALSESDIMFDIPQQINYSKLAKG